MNSRFWVIVHDSPVRLTLADGESLAWGFFEYTEEGWRSETLRFERDGDVIRQIAADGGRDCDGVIRITRESFCSLDRLASHVWGDLLLPDWTRERSEVFDEYAQAMGY